MQRPQGSASTSPKVGIFWDYENCELPREKSPHEAVESVRSVALGYGQVVAFRAYLEIPKNSSRKCVWIRSQLQTSGVSLIDCPHNGGKDVADKMMITDLLAFAIDTPPPATVVLISGDRDFSYPISTMRSRGYTVCLIAPTQSNRGLLALASRVHEWSDVMRSSATKSTSAYSYRDPEHTHRNTETPKRSPLMPLRQVDNLPRRLQNTDLPCSHSEQHHAMKDLTIGDVPQKRKRRSSETEEGQLDSKRTRSLLPAHTETEPAQISDPAEQTLPSEGVEMERTSPQFGSSKSTETEQIGGPISDYLLTLIWIVDGLIKAGDMAPLFSTVAAVFTKLTDCQAVYKRAGVEEFKNYLQVAKQEGVVKYPEAGSGIERRISLRVRRDAGNDHWVWLES